MGPALKVGDVEGAPAAGLADGVGLVPLLVVGAPGVLGLIEGIELSVRSAEGTAVGSPVVSSVGSAEETAEGVTLDIALGTSVGLIVGGDGKDSLVGADGTIPGIGDGEAEGEEERTGFGISDGTILGIGDGKAEGTEAFISVAAARRNESDSLLSGYRDLATHPLNKA